MLNSCVCWISSVDELFCCPFYAVTVPKRVSLDIEFGPFLLFYTPKTKNPIHKRPLCGQPLWKWEWSKQQWYLPAWKVLLGIPWHLVVRTLAFPLQRTQVQSLVRELRSCKPQGAAKKKRWDWVWGWVWEWEWGWRIGMGLKMGLELGLGWGWAWDGVEITEEDISLVVQWLGLCSRCQEPGFSPWLGN